MCRVLDPFRLVLVAVARWMNQRHLQTIDYLREENRVLREQLGGRHVRLNDDQRRRLATRAKVLGRRLLAEVATIVTQRPCCCGIESSSLRNMMAAANADQADLARKERLRLW